MGPRDFPIMQRHYRDPKSGWSLNWISAMAVGFAGIFLLLLLLWVIGLI